MQSLDYIQRFEKLGFGLFVHFGAYSVIGKGEWSKSACSISDEDYMLLTKKFNPSLSWAKQLVSTAKKTGCKYITLTARHHDGFSLYDTHGLTEYDTKHTINRDLIQEFVSACNEEGIVPFFYHTLLDWHNTDYQQDFDKYIDFLCKSIEVLCTNYGKIGGFWFDGMWDKPNAIWQEDRLYKLIRKYQPEAMIINNTGLGARGKVGHEEIDSVTFERGKPFFVDNDDKHRAGEMCQVLNDHWGYARNDCNYKSVSTLINDFIDCRINNCNFLLNTGLKGNGLINPMDKCLLCEVGKWVGQTGQFLYDAKPCNLKAENADVVFDGKYYYAIIRNVGMKTNANVGLSQNTKNVKIFADVKNAQWLDDGSKIDVSDGTFTVKPFEYGTSLCVRVARFCV